MPVRCTIIKLSYKMNRSPLIEVYTKLMLAETIDFVSDFFTNTVSDSHLLPN